MHIKSPLTEKIQLRANYLPRFGINAPFFLTIPTHFWKRGKKCTIQVGRHQPEYLAQYIYTLVQRKAWKNSLHGIYNGSKFASIS